MKWAEMVCLQPNRDARVSPGVPRPRTGPALPSGGRLHHRPPPLGFLAAEPLPTVMKRADEGRTK